MRRTLLTFQAVVSALPRALGSDGLLDTRARRTVSELLVCPSVCLSVRLPTLHQPPLQAEAPQTAPAQLSSDSKMSPLNSASCSPGRKNPSSTQSPSQLLLLSYLLVVMGEEMRRDGASGQPTPTAALSPSRAPFLLTTPRSGQAREDSGSGF